MTVGKMDVRLTVGRLTRSPRITSAPDLQMSEMVEEEEEVEVKG